MASNKPVIHGRDHLPGGADPIPRIVTTDDLSTAVSYGGPTIIDLPLTGGDPVVADGWLYDTTTLIPGYPVSVVHAGPGPDSLQWMVNLQEGPWTISFTHMFDAGVSDGVATLYVAGAYAIEDLADAPPPGDWLQIAQVDYSVDFGIGFGQYIYSRHWGLDGVQPSTFLIPSPASVPRYTLATSVGVSNLLNGSAGFYYIRLDGEGDLVFARALLTTSGNPIAGFDLTI